MEAQAEMDGMAANPGILTFRRWGYGVTGRLQRISPDVVLQYKDWEIPPGVRSILP